MWENAVPTAPRPPNQPLAKRLAHHPNHRANVDPGLPFKPPKVRVKPRSPRSESNGGYVPRNRIKPCAAHSAGRCAVWCPCTALHQNQSCRRLQDGADGRPAPFHQAGARPVHAAGDLGVSRKVRFLRWTFALRRRSLRPKMGCVCEPLPKQRAQFAQKPPDARLVQLERGKAWTEQ